MEKKTNRITALKVWGTVLICLVVTAGALPARAVQDAGGGQNPVEGFVYFADQKRTALKAVPVLFPAGLTDPALGRELLTTLFSGPAKPGLRALFPKGTRVATLFITEQGEAFVDLAPGRDTPAAADATSEYLAVYGLVNTLALNIPAVKRVKILVNGTEAASLGGHISLAPFFKPNMLIVK